MRYILDAPNMNHLWARLLIEELVRNGVKGFCLSPGSRSTPLAIAVSEIGDVDHIVHFDERASAFYALGWAKATGKPIALICTSGTAVANYLPAVVEASLARVPLLVLTADRPPELLQCGANQAIDQTGIFGGYVRWSFTLPCPDSAISSAVVLTTIDHAIFRALRAPAGPVHINCMFREPLEPVPIEGDIPNGYLKPIENWLSSDAPFTTWNTPESHLTTQQEIFILDKLENVKKGLLIIGELRRELEIKSAFNLAQSIHWPVFPDVTSGLRLGNKTEFSVCYYDQLLLSPEFVEIFNPQFVLHIGGTITSKRLLEFLEKKRPEYMLVTDHPLRSDPIHRVTYRFETDLVKFCSWLAPAMRRRDVYPWGREIIELCGVIDGVISKWVDECDELNEITVPRFISQWKTEVSDLFLGNSMPIRDADMYGSIDGTDGLVFANRGASGIDGNIATSAGFSYGRGRVVTAIVGDLSALHDLNSLSMLTKEGVKVILIIVNNDGGGIFSFLPISAYPETFEKYFGVPHGYNFEYICKMFGLDYIATKDKEELKTLYIEALKRGKSCVIEVPTNRPENLKLHRELQERIKSAVRDYLESSGLLKH
ncbi:MAG: 2-succinyl-5-enolpyruvyl-6-hydroxy-3-cyclohexene-1-carboxylic-acid synthase [Candidatus Hydrogenedentes bacterium]|nr:2-succinyl-5-enolpyruvyl-6-hydroxy-3-cyclohexene-1-carboxylic-acid synthase [Candidatus Hydrogenedentota bacterium]